MRKYLVWLWIWLFSCHGHLINSSFSFYAIFIYLHGMSSERIKSYAGWKCFWCSLWEQYQQAGTLSSWSISKQNRESTSFNTKKSFTFFCKSLFGNQFAFSREKHRGSSCWQRDTQWEFQHVHTLQHLHFFFFFPFLLSVVAIMILLLLYLQFLWNSIQERSWISLGVEITVLRKLSLAQPKVWHRYNYRGISLLGSFRYIFNLFTFMQCQILLAHI